jgi:hypothetical protein
MAIKGYLESSGPVAAAAPAPVVAAVAGTAAGYMRRRWRRRERGGGKEMGCGWGACFRWIASDWFVQTWPRSPALVLLAGAQEHS